MKRLATMFILILSPAYGLAQAKTRPADVSKDVEARAGHRINTAPKQAGWALPDGVSLDDGLTEEDAVAIALWNNPELQAELTSLGLARADLIEAGQLRNPSLTLIFPFSARILESVAIWPFETLWQRPRRMAAAKLELERVGESLVSRTLDIVRDTRMAYVDYALAQRRASISAEAMRERAEIVTIVNARFRAGDISELETGAARLDARLAEEQSIRFAHDLIIARDRLRAMLGVANSDPAFEFILSPATQPATIDQLVGVKTGAATTSMPVASGSVTSQPAASDSQETLKGLVEQALDARPELKAARLAIEAAGQRAKWERSRILAVSAIAKEYGRGGGDAGGFEQGPGLQIDLPIFNRNRGGISRAEAEIERAAKQLIAARQRVVAEAREAYARLTQARESSDLWRARLLPPLEEDIRSAERAYKAGDVSYLFVLETTRRLTDARLREIELQAATARALIALERSVGRRLIANH
jgi:cobalt-zinc-cadmium efflux system outer membrane protein